MPKRPKRKSPIRHNVKAHVRENHRIASYVRGKGSRVERTFTSRRKLIKTDEPKSYTINFRYSKKKGDGESVVVIATNYGDALDEAFEEKVDKRTPIEIEIIDPLLGRVFRAVGSGLKTFGKGLGKATIEGAKFAWKGAKVLGKEAALAASKKLDELSEQADAKRLLYKSYSKDRFTRLNARAKLRKKFPEIYTVADFSRPGETLYEVSKKEPKPLPPIIIQHRKTLIRLRRTMIKKHIRPIKITPQKRTETQEEYERRLFRGIKWAQAAIEKAS